MPQGEWGRRGWGRRERWRAHTLGNGSYAFDLHSKVVHPYKGCVLLPGLRPTTRGASYYQGCKTTDLAVPSGAQPIISNILRLGLHPTSRGIGRVGA
jgi:hypothetical protein